VTPAVPAVLAEMAQLLLRNAAPETPTGERASSLGLASALLGVAAEMWDGAVETLVQENRALAALLNDRADEVSLRLSALRAENARLRTLLIAGQVAAEVAGDAARQDAIWAELRASTERRLIPGSLV
jgi:hypothetical protein